MKIKPGDRVRREPDGPTFVVVDVAGDEPVLAVLRPADDEWGPLEAVDPAALTVVPGD